MPGSCTAGTPCSTCTWFQDRRFSVASVGITLVFFAMFGMFFLITQYFQLVLGYGTLEAGLKQLPVAFSFMIIAPRTPALSARFGANRVVARRPGARRPAACSLFNTFDTSHALPLVLVTMVLISAGMAAHHRPAHRLDHVARCPRARAGVGSAMNDTTRELGGALGVAVLGSLVLSQFQSSISGSISGLPERLATWPTRASPEPSRRRSSSAVRRQASSPTAAQDAYFTGMGMACTVAAVVALLAAGVVWRFLRAPAPAQVPERRQPTEREVDGLQAVAGGLSAGALRRVRSGRAAGEVGDVVVGAHDRAVGADGDAGDRRLVEVEPPRHLDAGAERPGHGGLDRQDVAHDHDVALACASVAQLARARPSPRDPLGDVRRRARRRAGRSRRRCASRPHVAGTSRTGTPSSTP